MTDFSALPSDLRDAMSRKLMSDLTQHVTTPSLIDSQLDASKYTVRPGPIVKREDEGVVRYEPPRAQIGDRFVLFTKIVAQLSSTAVDCPAVHRLVESRVYETAAKNNLREGDLLCVDVYMNDLLAAVRVVATPSFNKLAVEVVELGPEDKGSCVFTEVTSDFFDT